MIEQPKTGEWYQDAGGTRVIVVGMASKFRVVVEYECGTIGFIGDWSGWRHLPNCTGFNWSEQDRSNAGLLEALVNLRDNMDRLNKRVEKLEQASIPFQTIGGVALR